MFLIHHLIRGNHMFKFYLGDSVYAELDEADGVSLVLTTENGLTATNTIYIDPAVWDSLNLYVRRYLPDKLVELRAGGEVQT